MPNDDTPRYIHTLEAYDILPREPEPFTRDGFPWWAIAIFAAGALFGYAVAQVVGWFS